MKFKTKEDLARFAIDYYFVHQRLPKVAADEVAKDLYPKAACFVSVYIDGNLRGCIGDYEVFEPLYLNIIKNSIRAAFSDFRFPQIEKKELSRLQVEVSVLTVPVEYKQKNTDHFLKFLEQRKPGVILEKESQRALHLPQVWEKLPKPADFLSQLCLKASLPSSSWKGKEVKYWIFYLDSLHS